MSVTRRRTTSLPGPMIVSPNLKLLRQLSAVFTDPDEGFNEAFEDSFVALRRPCHSHFSVCSLLPSTSNSPTAIFAFFQAKQKTPPSPTLQQNSTPPANANKTTLVNSSVGPLERRERPEVAPNSEQPFKEILVTCNLQTESRPIMYRGLPRFVLYDLPDQTSSHTIRLIFAIAKIPYEFREVDHEAIKDFPLKSVPVLEIDGVKIGNTTTICRHLGWRYELSGQTALEDSLVDMIAETVQESRLKLKAWLDHIEYRHVDYSKPECSDKYAFDYLENYLAPIIENILIKSKSPWLVGYKMTWADLMVASFFNAIIYHRPKLFTHFPNIYLHNKKIAEQEEFEGMLYAVRERTVEVSLFRHTTKVAEHSVPTQIST